MTSPSTLEAGVLCSEPLLCLLIHRVISVQRPVSWENAGNIHKSAVEYFNILWPEFYELRLKFTHINLDLFLFVL